MKDNLSRRRFLEMVGLAGGSAALYETMTALGLVNVPEAWAGPPRLPQGSGEGKSVAVLGAGIGGLTTAYMLTQARYKVDILEAQDRVGGRSLTARRGTQIVEQSEAHGRTVQECKFDGDLYLNMGPGRLPYHHRRVLHYCRELHVPLEVYIMSTSANLFQTESAFSGKAEFNRRIAYDTQGYISELLAKAINKKALDEDLTEQDQDRLLSLLKVFGDLSDHYTYDGSTRAGCMKPLTVYQACDPESRLPFQYLLDADFWKHKFYQYIEFEWQPTLFQPVGGMDKIVQGFERALPKNMIHTQCVVNQVELQPDGVTVYWQERGAQRNARYDYCVSSIPLPILQRIQSNFSPDYKKAVDHARFAPTCKVGWQANRRFWEDDPYQIYGGISYIRDIITQMWYPSNDYFSQTGTLTGAYNYGADALSLGDMGLDQRLVTARNGAIRLHKEFADPGLVPQDKGLSIAWQHIPFQKGGWAEWSDSDPADNEAYSRLLRPDGHFHVVGDQVSTLPGWQEGAIMSAEHVVSQIGQLLKAAPIEVVHAPNTRRLVEGRF
ncbi:MAG TPA: FAD-dependent oxidoreductase [Blastocatellia bacterium]|nr:FAD-dependent oxidoreductase [Blastocatellia bacterium]